MLTRNMGGTDRLIRFMVGLALGGLVIAGGITGIAGTVVAIVAAVLFLTAAAGVCPLYGPLHITTRAK